jgi:hypothetical protein
VDGRADRAYPPLAALDYVTLTIRNHHDSGNVVMIRTALAVLAAFLDRLGRSEPAAIIAGFAFTPLTAAATEITAAIAHLRDVLGDQTYESLACKGETMKVRTKYEKFRTRWCFGLTRMWCAIDPEWTRLIGRATEPAECI